MEQKRVSFKVAKAIKEAGYLQGLTDYVYNERCCEDESICGVEDTTYCAIYKGTLLDRCENVDSPICDAPTYLDVWLWLWTNKNIHLIPVEMRDVGFRDTGEVTVMYNGRGFVRSTPEEAIIAAIDYLVDNSLIK